MPFDQLPEPRVAPQRIERRIDPEPAGREVERDPEQRLEPVEGVLRLTEGDPDELQLHVGAARRVVWDKKARAAQPLSATKPGADNL